MVLYLEEVSNSDHFSNIVNFPFILTGIDSLLPNRFLSFFLVISSRIPVRFMAKCAIAATIAPSMRNTDKMTLTGAWDIQSQIVYQIIPIPIATIKRPDQGSTVRFDPKIYFFMVAWIPGPDNTEILILSDFVIIRTGFGSGTFGLIWFSNLFQFDGALE